MLTLSIKNKCFYFTSLSHGFSMSIGRNLCCYNIYTDFYNKKEVNVFFFLFSIKRQFAAPSPIISLGTNCALIFLGVSRRGIRQGGECGKKGGATSCSLHRRHLTFLKVLFFLPTWSVGMLGRIRLTGGNSTASAYHYQLLEMTADMASASAAVVRLTRGNSAPAAQVHISS